MPAWLPARVILPASLALLGGAWAGSNLPNEKHPDFEMSTIGPQGDFNKLIMGMQFLPNGSLVVATGSSGSINTPGVLWEGWYRHLMPTQPGEDVGIYLIENPGSATAKYTKINRNFFSVLSGLVVAEGKLYAAAKDGFYEVSLNDGQARLIGLWPGITAAKSGLWHQWMFTPLYWKGSFYGPWSGVIEVGGGTIGANHPMAGAFLKWDLTGKLEIVAGGLRSPNGAGLGPSGEMLVTDNQGGWLPSSTINIMVPRTTNGHRHRELLESEKWKYQPPVAWLDHGNVSRSPSEIIHVPHGRFRGQWVFGDVNNYGLKRLYREDVEGMPQGAVIEFTGGMETAATNRLAWGPDSALYVGTLAQVDGNWPRVGRTFPIYRFKEKPAQVSFELLAAHSRLDGIELAFTQPVKSGLAPGDFQVSQWSYRRSSGYGAGRQTAEPRAVSEVRYAQDRKSVFLRIPDLKDLESGSTGEGYVTHIRWTPARVTSEAGSPSWQSQLWYTLNRKSRSQPFTPVLSREIESAPPAISIHARGRRGSIRVHEPGFHRIELTDLNGIHLGVLEGTGLSVHEFTCPSGTSLVVVRISARGKTSASALANCLE